MTDLSSLYCLLGYSCNNDCLFCATGGDHKPDLSTTDAQNFLKQHLSYGQRVLFTGGEPTIRPDIIEISDFAHNNFGAQISMLTNARRFCSEEFTRRMVDSGLSAITPSLYSHEEKLHDCLTRRTGSYAQTVRGIQNLDDSGVNVQIRTLITRPTFTSMPETMDYIARRFERVAIGICAIDVVENAFRNRATMVARLSDAAPYVEKSIDVCRSYGVGVSVIDFPMCLLQSSYRSAVVPRTVMHSRVKYRSPQAAQLSRDISCTVGSHERCDACCLRDRCPGTWRSYISAYGDGELHPQA